MTELTGDELPNINNIRYSFDDLMAENITEEKSNAFLAVYDPFNDSVIMQYAKGRGHTPEERLRNSVLNIPGGNIDLMSKHIMYSNSQGNKYFFQYVPYGLLIDITSKIDTARSSSKYETVVAAAVREFFEETGLFVYFTDDPINNNRKWRVGERKIDNGKTILHVHHIYDISLDPKKPTLKAKQEDFYPIKFVCYYSFRSNGTPTYVIYAKLELPLPINKIKCMHPDDRESFAAFNIDRTTLLASQLNSFKIKNVPKVGYKLKFIDYDKYKKDENTTETRDYNVRHWGNTSFNLLLQFLKTNH